MYEASTISELFKQLPKDQQADVLIEIQEIFSTPDQKFPKGSLDDLLEEGLCEEHELITADDDFWASLRADLKKKH